MNRLGAHGDSGGVNKGFTSKRVLSANRSVKVTVFCNVIKQCFVV